MIEQRTSILLITGPVGVGKSVVADAIFEMLRQTSAPVALINFDELTYASPLRNDPYGTKLGLKNLHSIWENYVEAGVNNLIIPYVIEDQAGIEHFRGSIPGSSITVVRLDASIETLHKRLRGRQLGGDLEWHLQRAVELSDTFKTSDMEEIVVNTEGITIDQAAEKVLSHWDAITERHLSLG
jgi:CO dehydrogenase nickel-insertion accessory protein CooC1